MIKDAGYGPKLVREYNELNIVRFIKNEGPISRAELAKRYKISKAAVSEIIAHLLQQHYVKEVGIGESTSLGGRRPILLDFNHRAGYVIGIEIKRDHATVALGDLNASICNKEQFRFQPGASLKKIINQINPIIDSFLKKRWVKNAHPIGIGVAIPGLINYSTGKIQESYTLKGWQGFPIKKTFEQRYNIETIVENDVKAMSMGECRFGSGRNVENVIYLWVGDGLSAGIIINGELYRGVSASSGEIGYHQFGYLIKHEDTFESLYHGQEKFSDILSINNLLYSAARQINTFDLKGTSTLSDFFGLVESGNRIALEILNEFAALVGIISINLINTMNPELIILGGQPELASNKLYLDLVKERIRTAELHTPSRIVKVKSAVLNEDAGIYGAIGLILEDIFYKERLNIHKYRRVFGKDVAANRVT